MRWRAFSLELLELAERARRHDGRHRRRAARRRPAHPAHPGHRHRRGRGGDPPLRRRGVALRGPDGHRRGAEPRGRRLRHPDGLGVGRGAALRRRCAVAEGDPEPARRIESLLGVTVPHGELEEDARAWERGVDELAQSDEEVAEYVQSLEEAQDTAELPEASGDAIAREFERYLRGATTTRPAADDRKSIRRDPRLGRRPADDRRTRHPPTRGRVRGGRRAARRRRRPSTPGRRRRRPPPRRRPAAARLDPGVDGGQRAGRVEVVGEGGAHGVDGLVGDRTAVARQRLAPAREPLLRPRAGRSSVHSQSVR